jgi:hypothetical protein
MGTMQDYNTTIEPVGPSNAPFAVMHGNERSVWDLEYSDAASDSSEYAENGYTSAESVLRGSRISSARRKSAIRRARKRNHKSCQQYRPHDSDQTHPPNLDETQNKAPSTPPIIPISAPLKSLLAAHDTDIPALDHLWKLLDAWYLHRGRGERPPCAVEQSRLDHLHFIGTREAACTYVDRQGKVLRVTSLPLRGWGDRGLHIIIAFSSEQDPVIIRGRGGRLKEKSKDEGTTTFPFYIWQGISGDTEGWESKPSIAKVVSYSNPSFRDPVSLKRRRLEDPQSGCPSDSKSWVSPPKSLKKAPSLLNESFPELFAQLSAWTTNDPSGEDPAFVLNNQPNLYISLRYPEQRISYVDLDGKPVNVDLYSAGSGKKTVIVADGPNLGPAFISFDHFRKLPKYYTSYYRWTSARTWIEPPCVFKVFGDGPFEPPRKFIEGVLGVGWLAREISLAQAVSPSKASDCIRTVVDLLDEPALPSQSSSTGESQRIQSDSLPTPAADRLPTDPQGEPQNQQATCAALVQPGPSLESRSVAEMASQSEDMPPQSDQNKMGSEKHPIQVVEIPTAIKEVPTELNTEVSLNSRARSATNSSALNDTKSLNRPLKPERKNASVAESVSLQFISASAAQPRVRSFSQCSNVRLLFAHAKKGGLLAGEASAVPVLALRLPGVSEPITIALGDSEDFDLFVHLLEDHVALSYDGHGGFVVDVTADQLD